MRWSPASVAGDVSQPAPRKGKWMSLYNVLRTGVSGMQAQSFKLATVAENIANANTVGYKRASTEFSSLVLEAGPSAYSSGAVQPKVRYNIANQGAVTYTLSDTDIAVQGDDISRYRDLENSPGVHLHFVPEDYGLSASRNHLLDNTEEPVLFLCDDDFLATPRTRLDVALDIWNENPEIKILGGMFENFNYDEDGELSNRRYTSFDHKIVDHKLLPDTKIFIPQQYLAKEFHYVDETHYFYYTDTVHNCALMDRAYLDETGLRWDESLKISGEHEDFYLSLQRGKAVSQKAVAFTNALFVEHHRHMDPTFKSMRERKQFHIKSMEKSSCKTWVFLGKRIEHVESGVFQEHQHPRNK